MSLPSLSGEARALSLRLRLHVAALAATERNTDLETPASYIENAFSHARRVPSSHYFDSGGRKVRNVEVGEGAIVAGPQSAAVPSSPGADANASAVAVLIELAAMRSPARFVAFANEELPYSHGEEMGSFAYAKRARRRSCPFPRHGSRAAL